MKLRALLLGALILAVIGESVVEGARSRSRSRNRNRKRRRRSCHLRALDRCLSRIEKLSNDPDSSLLITSTEGMDQICTASQNVVKCMKGFMKKCGTPLQRELFDFGNQQFEMQLGNYCNDSAKRDKFLVHSPCIQSKVLSKSGYKRNCVDPFLAALDATKNTKDLDDRLDLSCCSINRWEDCLYRRIDSKCTEGAREAMTEFLQNGFGAQSDMLCKNELFDFKKEGCTKLFPPANVKAKGKYSDNPLTKYIATYFGFLF